MRPSDVNPQSSFGLNSLCMHVHVNTLEAWITFSSIHPAFWWAASSSIPRSSLWRTASLENKIRPWAGTSVAKKILGERCDRVEATELGIERLEPKISEASLWAHLGLVHWQAQTHCQEDTSGLGSIFTNVLDRDQEPWTDLQARQANSILASPDSGRKTPYSQLNLKMHIPTFGQVATIGMAFFAAAALAAPIAEPLDTDLVERSTDLAARGEGLAFTGAVSALEQRNSKKKCKRTNNKGSCTDSDDDKKDNKKKQCKRNKKGDCSDSDDDKKDKKKKKHLAWVHVLHTKHRYIWMRERIFFNL
ncbi:hypothetical protein CNYM01_01869 [Colletotrichum nymphaeae SA-01]|uniref:Uncharacterized protein n=1 Tax=Colletotrichum nymphaeae SA-01 TaxID=1460502 RepID=A0A135TYC1_9PEZI|nr:hypothetical protein CNYM01_01869 [Colletotrichum nymphaeae SA-01]